MLRKVYRPGKFLSADLDKASEDNERNTVLLRTVDGHQLVVVQIAGLVARRIVCHVGDGDKVAAPTKPDDAERVERTVLQVGEGILGQDFEPRPSPTVCSWCDYRLICPAAES